jgi:hypothetical protein
VFTVHVVNSSFVLPRDICIFVSSAELCCNYFKTLFKTAFFYICPDLPFTTIGHILLSVLVCVNFLILLQIFSSERIWIILWWLTYPIVAATFKWNNLSLKCCDEPSFTHIYHPSIPFMWPQICLLLLCPSFLCSTSILHLEQDWRVIRNKIFFLS